MDWFLDQYATRAECLDPHVSPARSETLAACPPSFVVLAGFDVLRDEGAALADRLEAAGVATTRVLHGSLTHGFVQLSRLPACDAALRSLVGMVRGAPHP